MSQLVTSGGFSFRIAPSNDYAGLISFRIDWFNLAFSWQNSITFALLHSTFQGQICLLLQVFLDFLLLPSTPL